MVGVYKIGEKRIRLSSLHEEVHRLCADYRVDGESDFTLRTAQADIDREREKSAREDEIEGIPVRRFSDGYLESLAVCRMIAERMPDWDTILFHGSAVSVDGAGYLFTAKSGTGKSTHTRLWRELLGERAVMVNDDKPLIRVTGDGTVVCGTPWDGKHHLSRNIAVPLKAVCILERAEQNRIVPITKSEALPTLIQQAYRPADPAALAKTLMLIDRLDVCFCRLSCNMDISAAELSYDTLKG
ncbi:MAG: hypothetical protein K6C12_08855 [Oscillospiraceae bacterium]|nr:hypothetical protein [Oscillospiraceae bacterium]